MIYTGRYQDRRLRDATHLCVRTTRGAPRFPTVYTLTHELDAMKPPREALSLEEDDFKPVYEAHLARTGPEQFERLLQELEASAGDRPVVLQCFCDLDAGGFCHRRLFAWWLAGQGGRVIPELPA